MCLGSWNSESLAEGAESRQTAKTESKDLLVKHMQTTTLQQF